MTLLIQQFLTTTCGAFTLTSPSRRLRHPSPSGRTTLNAKKANRKAVAPPKSGAGFGKAAATESSLNSAGGIDSTSSKAAPLIPFSGQSGSGTKALRKVSNQYDSIRKEYGKDACRDVYVRSPLHSPTTYWFVGKIACVPSSGVVEESTSATDEAVLSEEEVDTPRMVQTALALKRIIFEYAKDQLRPTVMGGKYASALQLWLAPADSELETATNKVSLRPVVKATSAVDAVVLVASDIGYDPEIYLGEERLKGGLRVELGEEGVPIKPPYEVNLSA
jgi:hypothetical protein